MQTAEGLFSKLKAEQTNLGFCGSSPESFVNPNPSLHSQENRGSWQWTELLQTSSPWAELKIHPQSTKTALCTFFSCKTAIKKKNPCISRSIFLYYALRKALLEDQFYNWNWKIEWRTITLFKALLQKEELGFTKPWIPKIMNWPEKSAHFVHPRNTELHRPESTVLAPSTA